MLGYPNYTSYPLQRINAQCIKTHKFGQISTNSFRLTQLALPDELPAFGHPQCVAKFVGTKEALKDLQAPRKDDEKTQQYQQSPIITQARKVAAKLKKEHNLSGPQWKDRIMSMMAYLHIILGPGIFCIWSWTWNIVAKCLDNMDECLAPAVFFDSNFTWTDRHKLIIQVCQLAKHTHADCLIDWQAWSHWSQNQNWQQHQLYLIFGEFVAAECCLLPILGVAGIFNLCARIICKIDSNQLSKMYHPNLLQEIRRYCVMIFPASFHNMSKHLMRISMSQAQGLADLIIPPPMHQNPTWKKMREDFFQFFVMGHHCTITQAGLLVSNVAQLMVCDFNNNLLPPTTTKSMKPQLTDKTPQYWQERTNGPALIAIMCVAFKIKNNATIMQELLCATSRFFFKPCLVVQDLIKCVRDRSLESHFTWNIQWQNLESKCTRQMIVDVETNATQLKVDVKTLSIILPDTVKNCEIMDGFLFSKRAIYGSVTRPRQIGSVTRRPVTSDNNNNHNTTNTVTITTMLSPTPPPMFNPILVPIMAQEKNNTPHKPKFAQPQNSMDFSVRAPSTPLNTLQWYHINLISTTNIQRTNSVMDEDLFSFKDNSYCANFLKRNVLISKSVPVIQICGANNHLLRKLCLELHCLPEAQVNQLTNDARKHESLQNTDSPSVRAAKCLQQITNILMVSFCCFFFVLGLLKPLLYCFCCWR